MRTQRFVEQEAQLSQTGRATFRVIEYFATSLKVTENSTILKLGYGLLFAFHSNYGRLFSRFDTIHERDSQPDTQQDTARRHRRRLCKTSCGNKISYRGLAISVNISLQYSLYFDEHSAFGHATSRYKSLYISIKIAPLCSIFFALDRNLTGHLFWDNK